MSKPQLILLGAPGSGKGTQASKLVSEHGYKHLSTGDLLRKEISEGSDLGKKVSQIMEEGKLVDDKTVLELLQKNTDLTSQSYIFDGFPRNIEQAKALDSEVLKDVSAKAVYFDIDFNVLIERIVNRRTCSKCGAIYNLATKPPQDPTKCDKCGGELKQRKDDNEETVKTRLNVFKEAIDPVLDYYESKGALEKVDATADEDTVQSQLANIINS